MKPWFKFYGQEYLSDPKMLSLDPVERAIWLTILCLASSSSEEGMIKYINLDKIFQLTNVSPASPYEKILAKFVELKMITVDNVSNDNVSIKLTNYFKRQRTNLSPYERVKKHREKVKRVNVIKNVIKSKLNVINDNGRIDKNRIEKSIKKESIEKESKPQASFTYLKNIPSTDLEEFHHTYEASLSQIKDKAEELLNYCLQHGKRYHDYKAFIRNALSRDFGKRRTTLILKDYIFDPISKTYKAVSSSEINHDTLKQTN